MKNVRVFFLSSYSWIAFHEVSKPHFLHPINIQLHCLKNNQKQQTKKNSLNLDFIWKKVPFCTCHNQTYLKLASAYVPVNFCKVVSFLSMLTLIQNLCFNHIRPLPFWSFKYFKEICGFFFFCPSRI